MTEVRAKYTKEYIAVIVKILSGYRAAGKCEEIIVTDKDVAGIYTNAHLKSFDIIRLEKFELEVETRRSQRRGSGKRNA